MHDVDVEGRHFHSRATSASTRLRELVRYATDASMSLRPLCFVIKSTGIESVSTLTMRHAPVATRERIAAHRFRACLARPGVAVPALRVRLAELSVPMMVGAVGGMPKAVATARAYTANCEQRLVAMLSFSHEDSSLMAEAVLSFLTMCSTAPPLQVTAAA